MDKSPFLFRIPKVYENSEKTASDLSRFFRFAVYYWKNKGE